MMIDFHNHILPGVDDGAKTMEESIEMLRYAQEQGITDVVNTVHLQHPKMYDKNTDFDYVSRIKDDLQEEMYKNNININIILSSEVFFLFNLLDIIDNPLSTLGNKKYMLVEFQVHQFPKNFEDHLFKLAVSGVTPIIAHPERYKPIQRDISILEKLINSGCLAQLDGGSFLNHFGENCRVAASEILSRDMCHIIGSDAHNLKRNFCLKDAIKEASKIKEDKIKIIINDNPKSIVSGEQVQPFEILSEGNNKRNFFGFKKWWTN